MVLESNGYGDLSIERRASILEVRHCLVDVRFERFIQGQHHTYRAHNIRIHEINYCYIVLFSNHTPTRYSSSGGTRKS
jgi:hypothetical protein